MKMNRQDFDEYARVKTFNESVAETWNDAFSEVLDRSGRTLEQLHFLDYGCGDGKYFHHLAGLGLLPSHIHGIEISKIRVDRCQSLGWKEAIYVEKGQGLPYGNDYFDVVNMMEVIEHIPESLIASVLQEIQRVLRPEGVLIVSTPNYPIKRFYDLYDALTFHKWTRLKDDPTHVSFYNHARLRQLLGGYFERIDERCYKTGFLYRRVIESRHLMHKMLFLCSDKITARQSPAIARHL